MAAAPVQEGLRGDLVLSHLEVGYRVMEHLGKVGRC